MTKPGKTTTTTTTQACTDLPGWADAWEDTCQNYTSDSQWCGRDYLSVRGISSDKACCACGGGSHQVSTLGYDNVDEGKFSYVGNGYCHIVQGIYPWRRSPTCSVLTRAPMTIGGLTTSRLVLDIALKATVLSKGYICPETNVVVAHLGIAARGSVDTVFLISIPCLRILPRRCLRFRIHLSSNFQATYPAVMGVVQCSTSWAMATALIGTGASIEPPAAGITTPPVAVCRTANLMIQVCLSYCARMCMESLMPLEITGIDLTHELLCGCCISHSAAGLEWDGQVTSYSYPLCQLEVPISMIKAGQHDDNHHDTGRQRRLHLWR